MSKSIDDYCRLPHEAPPEMVPEFTKLYDAIGAKDLKLVNKILREGKVDVNRCHPNYELGFPLQYAVDVDDLRIIRSLLKAGASPNLVDFLAYSIKKYKLPLAKLLIAFGADVNGQRTWEKDDYFETNLIRAARLERYPFVKLLLESGADANRHNADNESALLVVRQAGNTRLAKLIEKFVSDEEREWVEERCSPGYADRVRADQEIYEAMNAGNVERVLELIENSRKPLDAFLEPERGTLLEEAVGAYYSALKATCPRQTFLQKLRQEKSGEPDYGHPRVVATRKLIEILIDMGVPVDKGGWRTPLGIMIPSGDDVRDMDLVHKMLAKLDDIESELYAGEPLLLVAAQRRNVVLTKFALERGANPNVRNSYGESILQLARGSERFEGPNPCVPLLLEAGAKD